MHVSQSLPSSSGLGKQPLCLFTSLCLLFTMTMDTPTSKYDVYDVYSVVKADFEASREGQKKTSKLPALILTYLFSIDPLQKFQQVVQNAIDQSVKNCTHWTPQQAAKAFSHVEKFALNLVELPWQREFKTIKMYTGFWKLKVERHFHNVLPLFEKMGYRKTDVDTLELTQPASRDALITLAADCHCATVEMQIYSELLQLVDPQGYNLLDVHSCRTHVAGNKEECIDWIHRNCNPSFVKVQGNFEKRASQTGDGFVPQMELDLQESGGDRQATTDSGYISKNNTEDLTTVKGESELGEGAVGGRIVAEVADSGSEDTINAATAERVISVEEEDIFVSKPWDEHIKSSYKVIDRTAPKSERGVVRASVSVASDSGAGGKPGIGAGWGADWEHVRQDLQRKFGDDYYAGLRGDYILGQLQGRLKPEHEDNDDDHDSRGVDVTTATDKSQAPVATSHASHAPNTALATALKSGSVTARKPISVATNPPQPTPVYSGRVITADVHSSSPISPGSGKIAGINKSTNRRSAPPVPVKSCAQQYQQQNSQLEEFLSSTQQKSDSFSDIKHPPAAPTLGAHYEAPNFSTFGHTEDSFGLMAGVGIRQPNIDIDTLDAPNVAVFESGIGNGAGVGNHHNHCSLVRRMYQADSLQSLNRDDANQELNGGGNYGGGNGGNYGGNGGNYGGNGGNGGGNGGNYGGNGGNYGVNHGGNGGNGGAYGGNDFPPPPSPQTLREASEPLYSKPNKQIKQLAKVPQYGADNRPHFLSGGGSGSVGGGVGERGGVNHSYGQPQSRSGDASSSAGEVKRHTTAPIIPRRPAPSPPRQTRHHTEPLLRRSDTAPSAPAPAPANSIVSCTQCTFANPRSATHCQMCHLPIVASSSGGSSGGGGGQRTASSNPQPVAEATGRACPKCTFSNSYNATKCKICREPFPVLTSS